MDAKVCSTSGSVLPWPSRSGKVFWDGLEIHILERNCGLRRCSEGLGVVLPHMCIVIMDRIFEARLRTIRPCIVGFSISRSILGYLMCTTCHEGFAQHGFAEDNVDSLLRAQEAMLSEAPSFVKPSLQPSYGIEASLL